MEAADNRYDERAGLKSTLIRQKASRAGRISKAKGLRLREH
jgi:hypothetical protein